MKDVLIPPLLHEIERVSALKCLGVTLQSNFSFSIHISEVINSCASNLFALRMLKAKGLSSELLSIIFKATVLSKLSYASQLWWGFLAESDKDRLEAFLRRASRCSFYDGSSTFCELAKAADTKLFNTVLSNHNHVLLDCKYP